MPATELNLRPRTDADMAFLQELYATTRALEMSQAPWDQTAIDAFLTQQFNAQHDYYQAHYPDAEYCVIEHGGSPIGRLYVFRGTEQINLMDIALLPHWQRRGIGTHYLSLLAAEADSTGKAMRLFVEADNPARRLYSRFGFVVTGNNQIYLQMHRGAQAASALGVPA
ncbi:GNAT family N-acetyltransferase [Metapseudomonas resinovorans]|uniref:GNAT family N-acetyltransferase n=1 Tax=Metapseudomonas resinovorans TaxID=53412 RepID=UPI000410EBAD|nr:GNAT family N-acetyltransferase [Pseudomonas resinovorans]